MTFQLKKDFFYQRTVLDPKNLTSWIIFWLVDKFLKVRHLRRIYNVTTKMRSWTLEQPTCAKVLPFDDHVEFKLRPLFWDRKNQIRTVSCLIRHCFTKMLLNISPSSITSLFRFLVKNCLSNFYFLFGASFSWNMALRIYRFSESFAPNKISNNWSYVTSKKSLALFFFKMQKIDLSWNKGE